MKLRSCELLRDKLHMLITGTTREKAKQMQTHCWVFNRNYTVD